MSALSILNRYMGAEELEVLAEEVVEEITAVAEEAARAEVAEATVEMQEAAAEVEELCDAVEELEETVEELEEVIDGMENLMASGNFNGGAFAHLYNRGVKLSTKLGAKHEGSRLGAENFCDAASAQVYSRDGMESMMDSIKGYAKTAVAFIKNIFNSILSFFGGLFNKVTALKNRGKQLETKLSKAEKLKEKIKLGQWNAYIDYTGKHKNPAGADARGLNSSIDALMALSAKGLEFNASTFNSAYSSVVAAAKNLMDSPKEQGEGSSKAYSGARAGINITVGYRTGVAETAEQAVAAMRALKIDIRRAKGSKVAVEGEVDAKSSMNAGHLKEVVKAVVKAANDIEADAKKGSFTAAMRDKIVGTLNSIKPGAKKEGVNLLKAGVSSLATVKKTVASYETTDLDAHLSMVAAHV